MSLRLRLATPDDAGPIQAIYAPYCLTPISFEMGAPSVEEMRRRIETIRADYPWLVCEEGTEILGYTYGCRHRERAAYRWSVDVSIYVRPQQQRRGLGRGLYRALFDVLVLQGYFNAYAGITLPNPASVGLHTSVGFQPVGVYRQVGYKCGSWHDVGWYQRPLQPLSNPPQPPKRIHEVAWEAALVNTAEIKPAARKD